MKSLNKFQNEFHSICEKKQEKVAITYYRENGTFEECSYIQMEQRVLNIVKHYKNAGICRGDRVAVLIPLCTNAYLDILALAYLGATSVVLDINLHEKELVRILKDADVSCIITIQTIFDCKLQSVNTPVLDISDEANWLREGTIHNAKDPDYEAIAILYSSGTTSQAKGVVIGYEQEIKAMDRLLEVVGTSEIRYLMLFPNSHVSGFTDFLVLLLRGGSLATMEKASAAQIVKGFQMYHPNIFGMVPKVWETFKNKIEDGIYKKGDSVSKVIFGLIKICGVIRKLTGINLGRKLFQSINDETFGGDLKQVHFGGGKSNTEVTRFFWNLGYDVFDFYASTEANVPILVTDGKKYMSSVGNIQSNPNVDIRVWNPDENGIGEIQVKSNTIMRGYFRSPELTKAAFKGEYFKTGDYGKIVKNQLYITGRIKESIHLMNGEKVSPEDIENSYQTLLNQDIDFAVTGLSGEDNYDQVCVFVVGKQGQYDLEFRSINNRVIPNYRYKKMVYVDSLPKTSVGKVKRYQLQKMFTSGELTEGAKKKNTVAVSNVEEWVCELIGKYSDSNQISMDERLFEDLNMDSLNIFEICVEIDNVFGVNIEGYMGEDLSVGELVRLLRASEPRKNQKEKFDYSLYPLERTKKDWKKFSKFHKWTRKNYDFTCSGLENLNLDENYIFAPNHESHFDSMWMMDCLPEKFKRNICSMAADYLFEHRIYQSGTRIMGAIPVHRTGNTSTAMKRAYELLKSEKKSLMIHPEGTRTRTGEMGKFKTGAAKLAIKTGVKIVPVCINGAYEIFPPDRKTPNAKRQKNGCKLPLHIAFGKPMEPKEFDDAKTMTIQLKKEVAALKNTCSQGDIFLGIVKKYCPMQDVAEDSRLEELGIDSLDMFQMFLELEQIYCVSIPSQLQKIQTVGELHQYLDGNHFKKNKLDYGRYPVLRTLKMEKKLVAMLERIKRTYDIKVEGLENIPQDSNCIISSNHASYLDPFFILAAFGNEYVKNRRIATLAAIHTLKENPKMFHMIGSIPVEREGNALPAIARCNWCLSEGYDLILFPEGARSRDGSMLPFKNGAAEMAIINHVPILPIRIDGAFEIFPRHIKKPRIVNKETGKKFKVKIVVGQPLWGGNMDVNTYTKQLKNTIERLGDKP